MVVKTKAKIRVEFQAVHVGRETMIEVEIVEVRLTEVQILDP
jgi:hypothetical protein